MHNLTRRKFLKTVSPALLSPMILLADEPKDNNIVKIVDKDYKSEILADNLKHPESVVVSPIDGRVFFAQKNGNGSAESVFELVDDKAINRFPGAGDPFGTIQHTKLAVNSRNELFVSSRTYIGSNIAVFDLKTGKQVVEIKDPFYVPAKEGKKEYDNFIENVTVNPIDDNFYMSRLNTDEYLVKFLDVVSKSIKYRKSPEIPSLRNELCFDSKGVLYFEDFRSLSDRSLKKIDEAGNTEKIVSPGLETLIGSSNVCNIEGLVYDSSRNRLMISGGSYQSKFRQICCVDLVSGTAFPIASMKRDGNNLTGFAVGKNGDVYLSTTSYKYPIKEDNGKIIKISKIN